MKHFCVVCGGSLDVPSVQPTSGVWSHTDPNSCVTVLLAQRSTLHEEVAAWTKRAQQAEAETRALRASVSGAASVHCATCRDTGEHVDDPKAGGVVYCECPIGEALGAAWMGTGHEEEVVEAVRKMLAFLVGAASPSAPGVSAGGGELACGIPLSEHIALAAGFRWVSHGPEGCGCEHPSGEGALWTDPRHAGAPWSEEGKP